MVDDPESGGLGQSEGFNIETEAVDGEARKDGLGGRVAEGLEAALGVLESGDSQKAEAEIKNASVDDSQEGLATGNDTLGVATAANDYIGLVVVEDGEEGGDELKGDTEVGVHEKDDVAGGGEHTGLNGIALAAADGIFDDTEAGISPGDGAGDGSGVVGAFFDDDDNLGFGVQKGLQLVQSGGQPGRFVPTGYDKADARSLNRHRADTMPFA